MENRARMPRWLVENDPAWQRTFDSDLGLLKWTKKGTNIQAVSSPASIYCEITEVFDNNEQTKVQDILSDVTRVRYNIMSGANITKYLSSRYLNQSFLTRSPPIAKNITSPFTNYNP